MKSYTPAKQGKKKDARRLIKLRESKEWTQRDAARSFYVSPGTIALWETGKRTIPGPALRLIELFEDFLSE